MSQTEPDLEKYRGTSGAEVKTANISSDDHPLKAAIGTGDSSQERIYDPTLAGQRFVEFYDDTGAAIREAMSNAETACIRRAKQELLQSGFTEDEIPEELTKLLKMAEEECGYEPIIEVTYNRKSSANRFIIEDNGIGISTEEYQVVQRVGYSTSHDTGERLGNFGIGWMSMFQLTGVNGSFKMSTKSFLTDEAYSTVEYVANFEYLDYAPTEYGTRFVFPGFCEEAKNIDIPAKVEEFADGMTIPVLYRDFDRSGNETSRSDDYIPSPMEQDYPDDALTIVAENEFFKAVMSPESPENRRGLLTYNISMPIRRNTNEFGSEPKFGTPWKWDFRAKMENGPIAHCPSDESLVGLVPKEDAKYEKLVDELKEKCVPLSEVPDDAIRMPEPASSRDSFKSGHDDFWGHVADALMDEWSKVAKEHFEGLDSWDTFLGLDRSDKYALFRAYSHFGPGTINNDPDNIQETLEDSLGVTVPTSVCEKIDKSRHKVNVVYRGSGSAHTKSATGRKKIWQVIDEAPDGVYMAYSPSQKKADIVWGLGETHFVRLKSGEESYREYEQDWGWEKAKDLPNRNLAEKLPNLDQDVIDEYEGVSASDSNNTQSSKSRGGDGKNPETYRLTARYRTQSSKYMTRHKVANLTEKLKDGDTFKAGRFNSCKYLVIRSDDESARDVAGHAKKKYGIAATRVPKYVYDHLKQFDNVYESYDEVYEEHAGTDVTLSDGTTMDVRDLPETDVLINAGPPTKSYFDGRPEDLLRLFGYDPDDYERYTWIDHDALEDSWNCDTDALVIRTNDAGSFRGFGDYSYHGDELRDLKIRDQLDGLDDNSDEYKALFGKTYGKPDGNKLDTLIEVAKKAGLGDNS